MCSRFQLEIAISSSVEPFSSCMKRFGGAPCVYVTSKLLILEATSLINS